ncbi:MAG: hypothetical protein JW726_19255, partial [Anaerolineales bacterium]|nr:hypothetical protein [Anaerolineales bacterium]
MKNIRTIIRTIILLALFFAPLSSAEPAAASVGNEHLTTQSASFAALPADLQTVVAETLQREGVMTAANDYDQQGKLLASGASGDNFGFSVAVDSTGTT